MQLFPCVYFAINNRRGDQLLVNEEPEPAPEPEAIDARR